MNLNLEQVPFSKAGSYLAFSIISEKSNSTLESNQDRALYLRTVHGSGLRELLRVELINHGEIVPYKIKATPTMLTLEAEEGKVNFCFGGSKVINVKGKGVGVRLILDNLKNYDNLQPYGDYWQLIAFSHDIKMMFIPLIGELKVDAPWEVMKSSHIMAEFIPGADRQIEFILEEFETSWEEKEYKSEFDLSHQIVEEEYQSWLEKTIQVKDEFENERELAAYVNWTSQVDPEGFNKRKAMYMSKNHMTNVWSWDHCFNAMALIQNNPQLSWDQYMFMFDHQQENGVLPDSVNDKSRSWSFVKPPIHGWALKWMMERSEHIGQKQIEEAYQPLSRWTNWWFTYRDSDKDGIPEYTHGNDSGWDNSTVFHRGAPIESPDLTSFLVLQMEVLADLANLLGKDDEAAQWSVKSKDLLSKMIEHSWNGDKFIAPFSGSHQCFDEGDSLLLYIPIILGKRLPAHIRKKLIADLKEKGRFLTDYGLATESIKSSYYESDGYWRGPIWAPSTMILVEGLKQAGETKIAEEVAYKFCNMVKKSGMAENFDAVTGSGLRDRAYTWTSSVFLIFANEYIGLS